MTRPGTVAAACVALLLALDASALALLARSPAPPTFARGGAFVRTESPPPALASAMSSVPTTTVRITTSSTVRRTTTSAPRPSTTVALPGGRPDGGMSPTASGRTGPPALGTYAIAVSGTESASIVGARPFASQMTLVAHRRGGVGPDQVVLDQEFSNQHEEREIVRYQDDGIFLSDESGSLSFGLVTQTSDVSYDPPMGQIPFPLTLGASRRGTSTARDRSGAVARVDDWTTRIAGQETLIVAGASAQAWVVIFERRSRTGTDEQVTQTTRYWFDPVRGISVRWEETVHGERNSVLIRATYDEHYVATLQAFRPA